MMVTVILDRRRLPVSPKCRFTSLWMCPRKFSLMANSSLAFAGRCFGEGQAGSATTHHVSNPVPPRGEVYQEQHQIMCGFADSCVAFILIMNAYLSSFKTHSH